MIIYNTYQSVVPATSAEWHEQESFNTFNDVVQTGGQSFFTSDTLYTSRDITYEGTGTTIRETTVLASGVTGASGGVGTASVFGFRTVIQSVVNSAASNSTGSSLSISTFFSSTLSNSAGVTTSTSSGTSTASGTIQFTETFNQFSHTNTTFAKQVHSAISYTTAATYIGSTLIGTDTLSTTLSSTVTGYSQGTSNITTTNESHNQATSFTATRLKKHSIQGAVSVVDVAIWTSTNGTSQGNELLYKPTVTGVDYSEISDIAVSTTRLEPITTLVPADAMLTFASVSSSYSSSHASGTLSSSTYEFTNLSAEITTSFNYTYDSEDGVTSVFVSLFYSSDYADYDDAFHNAFSFYTDQVSPPGNIAEPDGGSDSPDPISVSYSDYVVPPDFTMITLDMVESGSIATTTNITSFTYIPFPTDSTTTTEFTSYFLTTTDVSVAYTSTFDTSGTFGTRVNFTGGSTIRFGNDILVAPSYLAVGIISTNGQEILSINTFTTKIDFPDPIYGSTTATSTRYVTVVINSSTPFFPNLFVLTIRETWRSISSVNPAGGGGSTTRSIVHSYSGSLNAPSTQGYQSYIGITSDISGSTNTTRIEPVVNQGFRAVSETNYTSPYYTSVNFSVPSVTTPIWTYFTTTAGTDTVSSSSTVAVKSTSTVAFSYISFHQSRDVWQFQSFVESVTETYQVSYLTNWAIFSGGSTITSASPLIVVETSISYISGNTLFATRKGVAIFSSAGSYYYLDDRNSPSSFTTSVTYTASWTFTGSTTDSTSYTSVTYPTSLNEIVVVGGYSPVSSKQDYLRLPMDSDVYDQISQPRTIGATTATSETTQNSLLEAGLTNIVGMQPMTAWLVSNVPTLRSDQGISRGASTTYDQY